MESGTRKKRTLAERRESDKLRQRRFRAKKREQALLMKVLSGEVEEEEEEEKEKKQPTVSRKTAEEIRETNRIRQQRFRAKKRGEELAEPVEELPFTPMDFVLQTELAERERLTEIRREKDRIRKRRERQRKRERESSDGVLSVHDAIKMTFQQRLDLLEEEMTSSESNQPMETLEKEPTPEVGGEEEIDPTKFLAELEKMGLQIGLSETDGTPMLEKKSSTPESSSSSSSPSPASPFLQELVDFMFSEKKPWQRCHTSEERRQRERMRKRMYRAKQKFLSTGILDMQWDPSPIKRTPNDVADEGITPIPEWTKNLSSEQKLAAHRIYNKRYRERIRVNAVAESPAHQLLPSTEGTNDPSMETDLSSLPPEIYTEILTIISQCDLSSLIAQNA